MDGKWELGRETIPDATGSQVMGLRPGLLAWLLSIMVVILTQRATWTAEDATHAGAEQVVLHWRLGCYNG
jgi:hypothetical protein